MKTLKKSTSFLYHVMLTLLAIVIGAKQWRLCLVQCGGWTTCA